ncbi:MAG: hypothetical protein ABIL58_23375 [Pseudomonadota bacterium]
MACTCQRCGKKYSVDLLVPDDVWERIKPAGKPEGAGLLCGLCIAAALESHGGCYLVTRVKNVDDLVSIFRRLVMAGLFQQS